jgi:electron-transferring-flavoprotein dehydrogenase
VVHADYANPALAPFNLLQKFKTHAAIASQIEGGERLGYGARVIAAGGALSPPQMAFPGGVLVGCAAGMFNAARLKGVHLAILSGMAAAKNCLGELAGKDMPGGIAGALDQSLQNSPLATETGQGRRFKSFISRFGPYGGAALAGLDLWAQNLTGRTLPGEPPKPGMDRKSLRRAALRPEPAIHADARLTFDISSSLALAGVIHDESGPPHIYLAGQSRVRANIEELGGEPALYYCPAGVFELRESEPGHELLHVSAANCLHCRMCALKAPRKNVKWKIPPSGGPVYVQM